MVSIEMNGDSGRMMWARRAVAFGFVGMLLAACGNSVSHGDAAVDVREEGDLDLPRSSLCAQLEDGGTGVHVGADIVYCRLGAVENDVCWSAPPPNGRPGRCSSVTFSTNGVLGAYERNHRVPLTCVIDGHGPALCRQTSLGGPIAPENTCVPQFQATCVPFYPPDSGVAYACVPYHCD